MKKWSTATFVSVGALSLALAGPVAAQMGEEGMYEDPAAPDVGVAEPELDRQQLASAIRGSELMDMDVTNLQDEELGTISDILVNYEDGSISHVVLSRDGVLGMGEDQYLVPFDQVEFSEDLQTAQIDVREDQIEAEFAVFDEEMLEQEREVEPRVDDDEPRNDLPPTDGFQ